MSNVVEVYVEFKSGWYVKARVEQDVLLLCRGTEEEVTRNPFAYVVDQHYLPGSRKVIEIGEPYSNIRATTQGIDV